MARLRRQSQPEMSRVGNCPRKSSGARTSSPRATMLPPTGTRRSKRKDYIRISPTPYERRKPGIDIRKAGVSVHSIGMGLDQQAALFAGFDGAHPRR
jgi:hypothetical protein